MTKKQKNSDDIVLVEWQNIPENKISSTFRKKRHWVIDAPKSRPIWYSAVLSNLTCHCVQNSPASIEGVRGILQNGLSRNAFDKLKFAANISTEELAKAINIANRTLSRRETFRQDESERIPRVAAVFQRTLEVFGSVGEARRWFSSPKRALGNLTPLEFCDTDLGAEEARHLLGRIENKVFS